jgi:hypothetical protein
MREQQHKKRSLMGHLSYGRRGLLEERIYNGLALPFQITQTIPYIDFSMLPHRLLKLLLRTLAIYSFGRWLNAKHNSTSVWPIRNLLRLWRGYEL